jgi:rRNA maturation protein Nop10
MVRQMLQICTSCDIHTLKVECPSCGAKVVQAAAIKWSPEDQRAHLRRQLDGVEEEGWSSTLPTLDDSEE